MSCLLDFTELTPAAPVATFMQELNEKKTLSVDQLAIALPNLSCYMSCLPYEQVTKILIIHFFINEVHKDNTVIFSNNG